MWLKMEKDKETQSFFYVELFDNSRGNCGLW
jgi:hypothetical protein